MTRGLGHALAAAGLLLAFTAAGLPSAGAGSADGVGATLEEARAQALRAAREYRDTLLPLLRMEAEAARSAAAAAALERTRARMAEADALVAEADAARELAALPPPVPGELQVAPALIRHAGVGQWALAMTPRLQHFFVERFGRALPVSAYGQTPLHDRLGFDHKNALDVAVHPDSAEGRALLGWLRERGVSFLAFRGPVAGEATGAHVHVGEPSPRRVSLSR